MGWAVLCFIAPASELGTPVIPVQGRQLCLPQTRCSRAACQFATEGSSCGLTVTSGLKWHFIAQRSQVNLLAEALVLEETSEKGEEKREASRDLLPGMLSGGSGAAGCAASTALAGRQPQVREPTWVWGLMLGVEGRWEHAEVVSSVATPRMRRKGTDPAYLLIEEPKGKSRWEGARWW